MYYPRPVGYEWLPAGLRSLVDVEPYEVNQVLYAKVRRPIPAVDPAGLWLLTIWGRTNTGRALVIGIRQVSRWDWQIISARPMTDAEEQAHQDWEEQR
jgi:hypothetical protein